MRISTLGLLCLSSVVLPSLSLPQGTIAYTESLNCTFSCPEADIFSLPLVRRPNAVGYDSFYSIFQCIYLTPGEQSPTHKCTYDKASGKQRLSYIGDGCPPTAVPCLKEGNARPPMFSNQEKDEVPPWVEGARYLMYLKEHKP
ncbi:hypothetical protein BJ912DRAFT_1050219 [Pholiota molesta]|nr:hypothetical protein BJ912DRAFT_1050219 [Pholiota molesta]